MVAAIFGIASTSLVSLVNHSSKMEIKNTLILEDKKEDIDLNVLDKTAELISVDDFTKLCIM